MARHAGEFEEPRVSPLETRSRHAVKHDGFSARQLVRIAAVNRHDS
jgi:hypothetical protein